jgi:cytidylate kinase
MYRVLTVSREYGSGGGRIAQNVSQLLGWDLLDKALIQKIAAAARVNSELVQRYDERTDSWIHRISRRALWHGAFEAVAAVDNRDFLDAETMALLARNLIQESREKGNCVVVGRGAQCALQECPDAFHVFIYAPWKQRIARALARLPEGADVETQIRKIDQKRAEYIRLHYGCSWLTPHLYHLMVNSELGEDLVASLIVQAITQNKVSGVPRE